MSISNDLEIIAYYAMVVVVALAAMWIENWMMKRKNRKCNRY